jgi:hypothetical protein
MKDFISIREAMESGDSVGAMERFASAGIPRETMENFISAVDYFITLEKNARDNDVKEKNEQGRTD